MSTAKNILITGANRGIGLEFARQYAEQGHKVFATSRDNYRSAELKELQQKMPSGQIQILPLEAADDASRKAMKKHLGDVALDLFINNAGIYGPRSLPLGDIDEREWLHVLHINTVAPLKMVEVLRDNLRAAENGATVAVLSSKMGSIADNSSGGNYLYRSSKAAINCVVKSMAIDLAADNINVVSLHPGWVKTDMGGPNALIDTTTSVAGQIKVLNQLTKDQSGLFLNYDGSVIPW